MMNISFTVYKNVYLSVDPAATIERIEVERLSSHPRWSSLCECGAQQHVDDEYDAYYFRSDDMVKAMDDGLRHYRDNDLRDIGGEYPIFLYGKDRITLDELFTISAKSAYDKFREYINDKKNDKSNQERV